MRLHYRFIFYSWGGIDLKLRFWGTRGSIPSPGPETVKYGGNTSCIELQLANGTLLVFDAGTGIKDLGDNIIERKYDHQINLFLSHSHWDHIQGFPFFQPAYNKNVKINIYSCPPIYEKLKKILTNQMESQYFPVNFDELEAKIEFIPITEKFTSFGKAIFSFIKNNHPGVAYGFKVIEENRRFVFITDNELIPPKNKATNWESFIEFCTNADVLIHDAQFQNNELIDNLGFGHSTYEQTVKLALDSNVKHLIFFHHSPSRKDHEIDAIVNNFQKKFQSSMKISAAMEDQEIIV